MHLGIITSEYPPALHGGSGSSYQDLAESLAGIGHKVTVVGIHPRSILDSLPPEENIPNLRIVRLPQTFRGVSYKLAVILDRYRITRWLKREHKRNPFDVI